MDSSSESPSSISIGLTRLGLAVGEGPPDVGVATADGAREAPVDDPTEPEDPETSPNAVDGVGVAVGGVTTGEAMGLLS